MRRKIFQGGVLRGLIVALVLALCSTLIGSNPALALSVDDYFSYSYTVEFDKTYLRGAELFYATIIVTGSCTKDLPWPFSGATQVQTTGRIIATNQATGVRLTLKSSYTVTLEPVPTKAGETAYKRQVVELQFPPEGQAGTYSVIAELIEAKVMALSIWWDVTDYFPPSETIGTVQQLRSGGGGGYVAPPPPAPPSAPELPPGTSDVSGFISADGMFTETVVIESVDSRCWLTISEGTVGLSGEGVPLATIAMNEAEDSLAPPGDFNIIGLAYTFKPDGTTFDPLITVTITYDESLIPTGILEQELVIAHWDEATQEWTVLDGCTVNPEANTITAPLSHFSTFTILAPIPEAVFTTSELSITPAEVYTGEEVTIGILVTNIGNLAGSYKVGLRIDGVLLTFKPVTLEAGASEVANFTIAKGVAGTYAVTIDGLSDTFVVSVPRELPAMINWWLVGGIIAAAVVLIVIIPIAVVSHRRKARYTMPPTPKS